MDWMDGGWRQLKVVNVRRGNGTRGRGVRAEGKAGRRAAAQRVVPTEGGRGRVPTLPGPIAPSCAEGTRAP